MSKFISSFVKGEEGATMIEYGLMVALIAVVVIATVTAIGIALNGKFGDIEAAL
jgi:pilus assembly protein Flp/PilA